MPSVPPDRERSGLRPLDEYQVVPGIQGLPSAARVRASSQVMPWRAAYHGGPVIPRTLVACWLCPVVESP
jgi:hypothetical protein